VTLRPHVMRRITLAPGCQADVTSRQRRVKGIYTTQIYITSVASRPMPRCTLFKILLMAFDCDCFNGVMTPVTELKVTVKVGYLLQRFLHDSSDSRPEVLYNLGKASDWHELMIPQHTMRPYIARISEQLDPRVAASRHTTAPISHTRPSPRSP